MFGPTNDQNGLRQLAILLALITALAIAAFFLLSPSAYAATPPAKAKVTSYVVADETNVSAKERGKLDVFCNVGDQPSGWKVTTKVKKYVATHFQFNNTVEQGGVNVVFTGNKDREQTLTVRLTCQHRTR